MGRSNGLERGETEMTRNAKLFLLGMFEFRRMITTHFDYPEIETYDWGREWAHRLTFRLFENNC